MSPLHRPTRVAKVLAMQVTVYPHCSTGTRKVAGGRGSCQVECIPEYMAFSDEVLVDDVSQSGKPSSSTSAMWTSVAYPRSRLVAR